MEVNSKLTNIEKTQADTKEDCADLKYLLTGNGTPEKGLILKVDRLDQESLRREKRTTLALGAAITSIAGFVIFLVKMVMTGH